MRFGYCTNMVGSQQDRTGFERVATLKNIGYDYVELPIAEMAELPRATLKALVRRLDSEGIKCEVCNNLFPRSVPLTGSQMDIRQVVDYAKRAFEIAGQFGAEVVVFGSGTAKRVPAGFSYNEAYAQIIDILQRIAPLAYNRGIKLVLEPIRRPNCNIINTFMEAVEWRDTAQVDHVMILLDYYHMQFGNDSLQDILEHGAEIGHIHLACPVNTEGDERFTPLFHDGWDYTDFISIVKTSGYENRISIEAYTRDFSADARETLTFSKSLLLSSDTEHRLGSMKSIL